MRPPGPRTVLRHAGRALVIAALAGGLVACAKREPPSGGPPDIESPRVIASMPDSGSAGVARDVGPVITFSEGMEPRATEAAISLAPHVEIARRRWRGRSLTVTFAESLEAGRTYTLSVGNTVRDRHGNPMGVGRTVVFSTGDHFPRGRIEGEIVGRGFSAGGTQLWVYEASRTGVPDSTARDFDALGFAATGGAFRVDGLDAPGRYRVWGFADLNHNRSFEPEVDVIAAADTVIELTAEQPLASNLQLTMVNLRAPGEVKGVVLDSLGDTTAVLRVVARSLADTSRFTLVALDDERAFEVQLQSGAWEMRAFADLDRNRTWDPAREPASAPVTLEITPASELQGLEFTIRPLPGGAP